MRSSRSRSKRTQELMYQIGSIGPMQLPQAKMPDPRSAKGRCQCSCRTHSVLQVDHMYSFGPFRPERIRPPEPRPWTSLPDPATPASPHGGPVSRGKRGRATGSRARKGDYKERLTAMPAANMPRQYYVAHSEVSWPCLRLSDWLASRMMSGHGGTC